MGYSRKNVQAVQEDYEKKREKHLRVQFEHTEEVYSRCPEIREIDSKLSHVGLDIFKATMMGKEGVEERINALRDENLALQKRRGELLVGLGYNENYTDLEYDCSLCQDTGYQGVKMCSCLKNALTMKGYESSGIINLLKSQSFESFSLDLYPPECQDVMKRNCQLLHSFADDFENRRDFFLLVGGTGLGKTHLSTSVAKSLIDNGYDVVYEIAQNIFSDFDTDRFRDRFSDEEIISNKYFECDLLIIDDLGTEIITANSVSYLYNIINTRINKKLPIIISTNLSARDIKKIYHERITSRLFGEFNIVKFEGVDVRQRKLTKK